MKRIRLIAIGAMLALAAIPTTASAAPNVRDVAKQVRDANSAIELARQAAVQGDVDELLAQLQADRRSMGRAERKARAVEGVANKARAQRKLASHYDLVFDQFAAIIDELPAEAQARVLGAIQYGSSARDEVIARLTALASRLPDGAQQAVTEAVVRMQTDGDLKSLVDAIGSDDVGPGIRAALTDVFGEVTSRIEGSLDDLEAIVGTLPPEAQGHVQDALARVRSQLAEVLSVLEGILGSVPGGGVDICSTLGGFGIPLPICK